MKRTRTAKRDTRANEAATLQGLAIGLAEAGGRLEYRWWEARLNECIDALLENGQEEILMAAIEQLFEQSPQAHDALADVLECRAETAVLDVQGQRFDVQLIAVPVLAWSRFQMPAGALKKTTIDTFGKLLRNHVLAQGAQLALADYLFSPDQLPRSFDATRQLTHELGQAALEGKLLHIDPKAMPETNRFLSDARYLLGVLVVPQGNALFCWNESNAPRETLLENWVKQLAPTLENLLTGCNFQPLLPNAYHAACRDTDRASRAYAIRATLSFLSMTFNVPLEHYTATIAPFHGKRLEEYRVGFGPHGGDMVFYGVVWPLLGGEDEASEAPAEIEKLLRDCGLQEIVLLEQQFPLEYCDDCGAPMFPNIEGELVHAEMPEIDNGPGHSSQVLH